MKSRLIALLIVVPLAWVIVGCKVISADSDVAFLGDSITKGWDYPRANFGIFGNTTAQMLTRFGQIVPGHNYRQVVILGGTNDVLLKVNSDETINNLETLGEKTVKENSEPVLCEIPPIFHNYIPADKKNYMPAVIDLNRQIVLLAQRHQWKLVDYYTPLINHPNYLADGVHMKRRGYLVMEAALIPKLFR